MYFAPPIRIYLSHSRYWSTHCRRWYQSEDNHHSANEIYEVRHRVSPSSRCSQHPETACPLSSGAIRATRHTPIITAAMMSTDQPNGNIKPTNQGSSGHQDPRTMSWDDGDRNCQCGARRPIDQYLNKAHAICPQPQAQPINREYCCVIASHLQWIFYACYSISMIVYSRYRAIWIFLDWYKQVNHEIHCITSCSCARPTIEAWGACYPNATISVGRSQARFGLEKDQRIIYQR